MVKRMKDCIDEVVCLTKEGLSSQKVADRVGVDRRTVSRWLMQEGERPYQEHVSPSTPLCERLRRGTKKGCGVNKGCVEWIRARNDNGYGVLRINNRVWLAHRLVLEDKLGRALLPGEVTRHTCDNPPCVNPDHLIVGSQGDNSRDMASRGRQWQQKRFNSPEQATLREEAFALLREGKSQEEAAKHAGVTPRTIWDWLKRKKTL